MNIKRDRNTNRNHKSYTTSTLDRSYVTNISLARPFWSTLNNPEHTLMIDWYFQQELPQNQSVVSDTKITAISNTHLRGLHVAVNSHEHQHATMHVTSSRCFMPNYKR